MSSHKKLAITGIFWNGVQLIINQSFTFIIRLVLAKLLFPEQFGVIGMAMIFTGFVQVLNDLGIAAALVQRKDEDLREAHYHTAFWTGVIWSVGLFLIMSFLLGPFAASFYKEPMLKSIIPVLSIGILFSPINLVHKALLTKVMNFKKMAFIDNTSNIISGCIALILAYMGAGVWALVFNSVATIIISIPLYFWASRWYPKFIWDRDAFNDVFGFGAYTTGTNVINYLINNVDYLLIGKLLSAGALGAYTFAFVLTDTFRSRLMAVINNVMYPIYGKNQSDPQALKKYYLKVISYNSIIVYPIMIFMLAVGQPFIIRFFGEKWIESVVALKILAVSVMVHMLINSNTALIRGMGRPGLEFKLQIIKSVIFIPTLYYGIVYWGIAGAAYAVLINKVVAVIIGQYTFNYLLMIKLTTMEFFHSVKRPWLAAIGSYGLALLMDKILHVHFMITGTTIFISYFLIIYLSMGNELKREFTQIKSLRKTSV
ncbi:lipopolysaccharide biosynthesis protein [Pedobacter sp. AW31-3R]|uniref:lipopolysaccharide biosynthesis protein n=1 Tax=Pedobacter sp. AW31-3R TaxID=3445781 RepID=UPI003FA0EEDA